ncbi:glucosaminidase domain-containing protein [Tropicibacter sp. R16_0]|uniref:glucosaminidase domain-containing protein n=1 Tax=Tropicibacter sp. R16_0 TaxID=2821102 RepID=UPI001ADB9F45|nr:glucosaminidase domain-containing protein [Tropicibacter sp. R16_0]MBO9450159.1 glucosaminidase domain-containing protein [Tropicibacter sp. R16_0]
MPSNWEQLVHTYAQSTIPAPDLKLITLAQWALESNFGSSELATDHLNFAGLKFRARINRDKHYADPVDYLAHDGWDTYCKFASHQDFIDGYWAFINNGVMYDGWDAYAEDPAGYIGHLQRGGYAEDPDYLSKIRNILPRIRQQVEDLGHAALLQAGALQPRAKFRLAVLIGHNSHAKGAHSDHLMVSEWPFNQRVYRHMAELAPEFEIEPKQFFRQSGKPYEDEIKEAYALIDAWGPDAILELHFNSGGGRGTETLYWGGSTRGEVLARAVQRALLTELGLSNRGIKDRRTGRGSSSLGASAHPTILTEPFFGDSASDCAKMVSVGEDALARAYLIGARDAMEEF